MKILKTRSFTWKEAGLLKASLISMGILLGVYHTDFFATYMWLWWAVALVGAAYFLARFIKKGD